MFADVLFCLSVFLSGVFSTVNVGSCSSSCRFAAHAVDIVLEYHLLHGQLTFNFVFQSESVILVVLFSSRNYQKLYSQGL